MTMIVKVLFVALARSQGDHCSAQEECWSPSLSKTGKKAVVRANSTSRHLKLFCLATKSGTIAQQLQSIGVQERAKSRAAIESLIRCTHFLTRQHIAHSTNFTQLVDLIVSHGAQDLQNFVENAAKNAVYTSRAAVVDFTEALCTWSEERVLKRLQKASVFSVMANECTDITTIEELSVFCRWEEGGIPIECFSDILPLKKADAESICSALLNCLKDKRISLLVRLLGWGLTGPLLFLEAKQVSKQGSRSTLLVQYLCTVTVICCSWHVYKLPTALMA